MTRNTPPDGLDLDELMARAAADYEVDRARLRARLQQAGAGRDPRGAASRPRRWAASGPLIAAAAVVVVLLGVAAVVRLDVWGPRPAPTAATDDPTPTPTTRSSAPEPSRTSTATGLPAVTATSSGTGAPSPEATASRSLHASASTRPARTGPARATTAGTSSAPGRATATTAGPANPGRGVTVTTAPLPDRLAFTAQGYEDWVVVGARRDGKQIRLKRGSGAVSVSDLVGTAQARPAPFTLDWSDGAPEQDHTGAGTWWCAGNGGRGDAAVLGASVRGLVGGEVVTLVVGAEGSGRVKVEARLRGGELSQLRTTGDVVRIEVPRAPVGTELFLELTPADGGSASACLAAVAVR